MNKINRISENKNQKIDVLVVSEHCETIWIEKWKRLIIKGGGGVGSGGAGGVSLVRIATGYHKMGIDIHVFLFMRIG